MQLVTRVADGLLFSEAGYIKKLIESGFQATLNAQSIIRAFLVTGSEFAARTHFREAHCNCHFVGSRL